MWCGGCMPGAGVRSIREANRLATETGLSVKEVSALKERFEKIAPKGFMTREQFKLTLGMLGMTPNDYIPNRMFVVFDANGDGVLTFEEYLRSFAVLLRGTEDDRLRLSFHLADASGNGALTFADFKALVDACQSTTAALLDNREAISETEIRSLFQELARGTDVIRLEDYEEGVRSNPRFLTIIGLTSGRRQSTVSRAPSSPPFDEMGALRFDLGQLRDDLTVSGTSGDVVQRIESIIAKYASAEKPVSPARPGGPSRPPSPPANRGTSLTEPTANLPGPLSAGGVGKKRFRLLGPKKGMAVHFGHENWNMVLSMMIGIRLAVGRASFEINRPLTAVDFDVKDKFSIIPQLVNCLDSKISAKVKVTRFIDYAPLVFKKLREDISGISDDEYMRSVGPEQLLGNMVLGNLSSLAEQTTEGKGGAFFYYTADGRFMLKTVTKDEKKLLKQMLPEYYNFLKDNKDSFIVRFYGLHGLRLKRDPTLLHQSKYRTDEAIYFVVMGNMFNTPLEVHRRFDLKGSWVNRATTASDDITVAMKDNDFVKRGESIDVGPEQKSIICDQLRKDANFFAAHNVIDYSLLLGVHDRRISGTDRPSATGDWTGQARSFVSTDGTFVYYLGVIDILCQYGTRKKFENFFKSIRYDGKGISAVPAQEYADRFFAFISSHIE